MNFTEAVNEVLSVLKRPDKLADVRREVNSAITHFCSDASFDRDRTEASVAISSSEYTQEVALSNLTRYRKMWYVKLGGTKHYLKKLDETLLGKTCDMKDRYYVVGSSIRISSTSLAATLDIGYYQFPPYLTDAAPDFWMLEEQPYMVVDRALSKLFDAIGDAESSRRHELASVSAFTSFVRDKAMGA